jgi:hypothetical protein
MSSANNLVGFPVKATHKFRINGAKYRIGNTGVKAIELALELLRRQRSSESLLALRPLIRDCTQGDCKAALSLLIEQTPNHELKKIAIWLRGRLGGYIGSKAISNQVHSEDEKMRFVAAKALRRMNGWSTLAVVSEIDPSERVRRIATLSAPRQFRERLSGFSKNVETIPVSPKPISMFWSRLIDLNNPIRTKSIELIRRLLVRIRDSNGEQSRF